MLTQQNTADTVVGEAAPLPAQTMRDIRLRAQASLKRLLRLGVQLAFLAGVCYLGNSISQNLQLPIPGNIISMALLLALLLTGMLHSSKIDLASGMLLKFMPIFFIPAGVTVMGCFPVIRDHLLQFALVCIITTVLVYLVTSTVVTLMLKWQMRRMAKAQTSPAASAANPRSAVCNAPAAAAQDEAIV